MEFTLEKLRKAAQAGNTKLVEKILEQVTEFDETILRQSMPFEIFKMICEKFHRVLSRHREEPTYSAILYGNLTFLKYTLEKYPHQLHFHYYTDSSLMHMAFRSARFDCIKYLIEIAPWQIFEIEEIHGRRPYEIKWGPANEICKNYVLTEIDLRILNCEFSNLQKNFLKRKVIF